MLKADFHCLIFHLLLSVRVFVEHVQQVLILVLLLLCRLCLFCGLSVCLDQVSDLGLLQNRLDVICALELLFASRGAVRLQAELQLVDGEESDYVDVALDCGYFERGNVFRGHHPTLHGHQQLDDFLEVPSGGEHERGFPVCRPHSGFVRKQELHYVRPVVRGSDVNSGAILRVQTADEVLGKGLDFGQVAGLNRVEPLLFRELHILKCGAAEAPVRRRVFNFTPFS